MNDTTGYQPPPSGGFFASVRRIGIVRTDDRWIGGVCAGIAHRYGIDPILVRGLVAVSALFVGLGTLAYGLAWALLPEARDGRIHLEQASRGHVDVALAGAVALVVIALSQGVWWWGGLAGWTSLWVVVLGGVVVVIMLSRKDNTTGHDNVPRDHPGPYPPTAGPHPPPAEAVDPYPATPAAPTAGPTTRTETMTTPEHPGPGAEKPGSNAGQPTAPVPPAVGTPSPYGWDSAAAPGSGQPSYGPPPSSGPSPSGPAGPQPPGSPPPVPAGPPASAPQPKSSGATALLALGLCLLAAAGLLLAKQAGLIEASPALLIGGVSLAIIGAAVIISGVRGRAQGGLGVLGFFVALVMVPAAFIGTTFPGMGQLFGPTGMLIGESTFAPTSVDAATEGYTIGVGGLDVDLTALDLARGEDITVPVGVGIGELVMVVPDDWDITIDAQSRLGEVNGALRGWQREQGPGTSIVDQRRRTTFGTGTNVDVLLRQERDDAPTVHIDAHVGIGEITIEEQR